MRIPPILPALVALLCVVSAAGAQAPTLDLSALFSDGMVLQADQPVPVWGKASPGQTVTVRLGDASASAAADEDGRWRVTLPAMRPNATPQELLVTAGEGAAGAERRMKDVLVGEVWLCSGQSNMAYRMSHMKSFEQDAAAANDPLLRAFNVVTRPAARPQQWLREGAWMPSSPQTAAEWSAVALYFGQRLRAELNVPVGIILPAWGGSSVAAWTSFEMMQSEELRTLFPEDLIGWRQNVQPYQLYNGMLRPLAPYAIRGVIWYQGETEGTEYQGAYRNAYLYRVLFPAMIESWRRAWDRDDLPFYWVQLPGLANPRLNWPPVRESQDLAQRLPHTGMIPSIDIGDDRDLHPKVKRPLGNRIADFVMARHYGRQTWAGCPTFQSATPEGSSLRVSFSNTGQGLRTTDGKPPRAFRLAGEDGRYHDAEATLDGSSVLLSSAAVSKPLTVRYAFEQAPAVNLVNDAALPALPFRTDSLPVTGSEMTWRDLPSKRELELTTGGGELARSVQSAGWVASSLESDVAKVLAGKDFITVSERSCQIRIMDKPQRGLTESPTLLWTTADSSPATRATAAKGMTAEVQVQPSVVAHPLRGFDLEVGLKQSEGRLNRYSISVSPGMLRAFRRNEVWVVRGDLDNARRRCTYRLSIRPDGVAQLYLDDQRLCLLPPDPIEGKPAERSYVRIGKAAEGGEYIVSLLHVGIDPTGAYAP